MSRISQKGSQYNQGNLQIPWLYSTYQEGLDGRTLIAAAVLQWFLLSATGHRQIPLC